MKGTANNYDDDLQRVRHVQSYEISVYEVQRDRTDLKLPNYKEEVRR